MTTTKQILAVALAAVAVGAWSPAYAADTKSRAADVDKPADTRTQSSARNDDQRELRPHPGGLVEASWLIGAKVHDADGKDLGKIESLWLDPKTGQIKEATVTVGATLGVVGGKDKVVDWKDVKLAWKDQKPFVSVDSRALRDAYETKMDRDDRGPAASPATSGNK